MLVIVAERFFNSTEERESNQEFVGTGMKKKITKKIGPKGRSCIGDEEKGKFPDNEE